MVFIIDTKNIGTSRKVRRASSYSLRDHTQLLWEATSPMKIMYRPATESDYEFCRRLHHQGMRPYVEPHWGWKDEFQNPRYQKLWQPENIEIIKLDNKDIGYIEVSKASETIKLVNIFIMQDLRGQGIGSQVVSNFIHQYIDSAPKLTLNVLWNNPAKNLYERLGFKLVLREDQILKYEICKT